ncbi:hypothetical protein NC652_022028 [Populus alba x Populus x berolinensis]|nr:hypothetical protein NC652_022028 [Populus alba x Populus x berolinensis]
MPLLLLQRMNNHLSWRITLMFLKKKDGSLSLTGNFLMTGRMHQIYIHYIPWLGHLFFLVNKFIFSQVYQHTSRIRKLSLHLKLLQ